MKNIIKIIGNTFLIFLISALVHNLYKLWPCFFTSLIAPVNESIWEHNKMILLSYFIFSILKYIIHKEDNIFLNSFLSAIFCIILVLIIFTPIYLFILKTKDNLFITLIIYFICILLSQILYFKLKDKYYNKPLKGIYLFILLINLFSIFTFFPPHNPLFFDYGKNQYGLNNS